MSGGHFDYRNWQIIEFAESIEHEIKINGRSKTVEELKKESEWRNNEWYTRYPEDLCHHKYPKEVIKELKNAVKYLKLAHIYANRIDYLLSGDDGEENFLIRLKNELYALKLPNNVNK